jgi:hypothetical protein
MRKTSLNISPAQAERLAEIKAKTGLTLTAILEAAITAYHQHIMAAPALVLGYIQTDRPGDLDADAECRACGSPCEFGGIFWRLGLAADGGVIAAGPLCSRCATSD